MLAPVSITGDFAREYNFVFLLYENPGNTLDTIRSLLSSGSSGFSGSLAEALPELFDDAVLTYVSSLATKVSFSADVVNVMTYDLLGISYPEPKSIPNGTVSVTFYDDTVSTVYLFHKGWMSSIQDGAGFRTFDDVCLSMLVSPVVREKSGDVAEDIPTSPAVFQKVFPTSVQRAAYNKAGDNLAMVDVQYLRVPLIGSSASLASVLSLADEMELYLGEA